MDSVALLLSRDIGKEPPAELLAARNNAQRVATDFETGVDYVSIGALTKDIRAIDFSMRFE